MSWCPASMSITAAGAGHVRRRTSPDEGHCKVGKSRDRPRTTRGKSRVHKALRSHTTRGLQLRHIFLQLSKLSTTSPSRRRGGLALFIRLSRPRGIAPRQFLRRRFSSPLLVFLLDAFQRLEPIKDDGNRLWWRGGSIHGEQESFAVTRGIVPVPLCGNAQRPTWKSIRRVPMQNVGPASISTAMTPSGER